MTLKEYISRYISGTSEDRSGLFVLFVLMNLATLALLGAMGLLVWPLLHPEAGDSSHTIVIALTAFALGVHAYAALTGRAQHHARERLFREATAERARTHELFVMTDMLQSTDTNDDALAVLKATSQRLLPQFGAALYVFNNSRDRLDLVGGWSMPEGVSPAQMLSPSNCWALKRGKFHINDPQTGTLCCGHHAGQAATIEIPMLARGSVYGLLLFATDRPTAFAELRELQRLGRMLADSMSLALSNIALREQLRTQSLRDPLTGLYNRRYMEDALERYTNLADRTGSPTSIIMVDLDHFKMLNDQHGHAKGDAVLRDAAAQLVGGVRPSDVVCRYGGEELLVILPECGLEDAMTRAEVLRGRVESLSAAHATPISASFGVATIPETSATHVDLVAMADQALYRAKLQGRNCVVASEPRSAREEPVARLAVNR
ncbi:MAG TPA: sensor domain-containing diguanylate cyclase [Novosphingobium sp.]|nr:sensor domain-containing diguanylate cyclase [Novosphingobium sp.]